jgi:hypothetical protein
MRVKLQPQLSGDHYGLLLAEAGRESPVRARTSGVDPELPNTSGSFRAVNSRHLSRGRYRLQLIIALEHDRRLVADAVQFETHVAPRRIASEHHHAAF